MNLNYTADNKITYVCRLCGHIDTQIDQCLSSSEFNRNSRDYQLNPNMVYDPTLPRTMQITCPTCRINTEIVIFQYNPDLLNVGYMCTQCRTYWKN